MVSGTGESDDGDSVLVMRDSKLYRRLVCAMLLCYGVCSAQTVNLTGRVAFVSSSSEVKNRDAEKVVLWLTPIPGAAPAATPPVVQHPRLTQKNKSFEPHVLIVPVGSVVEFPNRDPFFHNVFCSSKVSVLIWASMKPVALEKCASTSPEFPTFFATSTPK